MGTKERVARKRTLVNNGESALCGNNGPTGGHSTRLLAPNIAHLRHAARYAETKVARQREEQTPEASKRTEKNAQDARNRREESRAELVIYSYVYEHLNMSDSSPAPRFLPSVTICSRPSPPARG